MKKQEKQKLVRRPSPSTQKPEKRAAGKRKRIHSTPNPSIPIVTENKTEEETDLPGYPHYPVVEDIMNSPEKKIGLDIENSDQPLIKEDLLEPDDVLIDLDAETELVPGTSSDVTEEEIMELGDKNKDLDLGDDETFPGDLPEDDILIPGAELDDLGEKNGSEDEENNYYSLGGDNHEN
jgi:hypothetical protein